MVYFNMRRNIIAQAEAVWELVNRQLNYVSFPRSQLGLETSSSIM